jgi:peptide/nickel transport system ATP-binding protein/glutathione transport system ATP-binding protein
MTDGRIAPGLPLLSVRNLRAAFETREGPIAAVRGLSFDVAPGETLAIVGESGSGKSVSALSILRLIEREGGKASGEARFLRRSGDVVDLMQADESELRRLRGNEISMIFQEPMTSLNPVLTIGRQIAEVLVLHQKLAPQAAMAEAERLLATVRIPDPARRLGQHPHELSGGMRQRVMIAMALACRPRLLIADEPTTALDVTVQAEILALIRRLQDEYGMALIFITHDMGVVAEIADRVVVMRHGEKVEENALGPLFAEPGHAYTRALLAAVPRLGDGSPQPHAAAAPKVLEVERLVKRFPVRGGLLKRPVAMVHAVEDVSFSLQAGETLGLVGESGCGKSTTGRALMRLVEPTSGVVRIAGRPITGLGATELRLARRDIQMIFQDPYASLNPRLSVEDSVTEPLAIHRPGMSRRDRRDAAAELMRRVGLKPDHLARYPHQFSGGQRQRIAIARALALQPKVIVADEPVSALDVSIRAQVIALLKELQAELGLAYLFISHDMAVVEQMSHRVAVMNLGEIVEIGPSAAVFGAPRHPYTRRLLASVPIPDPARRRARAVDEAREIGSPLRRIGEARVSPPLVEVGSDHFARTAA